MDSLVSGPDSEAAEAERLRMELAEEKAHATEQLEALEGRLGEEAEERARVVEELEAEGSPPPPPHHHCNC